MQCSRACPLCPNSDPKSGHQRTRPATAETIFADLIGKLDVLHVSCNKCGRDGCYGLSHLIDKRGRMPR